MLLLSKVEEIITSFISKLMQNLPMLIIYPANFQYLISFYLIVYIIRAVTKQHQVDLHEALA